jgi:hypothetical protein
MASSERVCANAAHKRKGVFVLREPASWTVLSSRHLPDASPFLKVRVETIRLPDGRCIPDYYQLDMPSFACILAEIADGRTMSTSSIVMGRAELGGYTVNANQGGAVTSCSPPSFAGNPSLDANALVSIFWQAEIARALSK